MEEIKYHNELEVKIAQLRDYKVVKSNDLIQKSRFKLSLQEQKVILYLISKIRPEDMELQEHVFNVREFCKICGLETDSGANYKYIKRTLKELRDRSIWVTLTDGSETTLAWIDKITMNRNSGKIIIKIDDMMKPYLIQLQERFTSYELFYTLAMRSQYSIRLYELLKSYEYVHKKVFEIGDLKQKISAETYERFPDFRRNVLEISAREINELSDLTISYNAIKEGRRYSKIEFSITLKQNINERLETWTRIEEIINPRQMTLFKDTMIIE